MNETNIPTHEFHTQSGESPAHMACSSYSVSLSLPVCYRYSNECYCRSEWEKGRKLWFGPRQVRDIIIKCAVCVCEGGSVCSSAICLYLKLCSYTEYYERADKQQQRKKRFAFYLFFLHTLMRMVTLFSVISFSLLCLCVLFLRVLGRRQ